MKCVFCNKEVVTNKRWHIDCLDTAIETEFGIDIYNHLLIQSSALQKNFVPFWVERLVKEGVEDGRRHKTLFRIFASLSVLGVDYDIIKKTIIEFNDNCRPPLPKSEIRYHVRYLTRRFKI